MGVCNSMLVNDEIISDINDICEYTLAMSKVIKNSDKPEIEKVQLLSFIRGIEFEEEIEATK